MKFKFSKYAGSHVNLIDEEDQQGLPPLVFEQDQIDAERSQQEEVQDKYNQSLSNIICCYSMLLVQSQRAHYLRQVTY